MTIKYFVDDEGRYLGAFDGADPPEGSVEIDGPPIRAFDIWTGTEWITGTVPVPQSVTMCQMEIAVLNATLTQDINDAIDALSSPRKEKVQIARERSATVQRDCALAIEILTDAGLNSGEIDSLFIQAGAIDVDAL